MYRNNSLKAKLVSDQNCIGCWLSLGSASAAEIVAQAGFDAILIDHEHGPRDLTVAADQLRAVWPSGTTFLMRIPSYEPAYVSQALDMGIEGLVIPGIESAAEAEAVVAACRFPPRGRRGISSVVRASTYGLGFRDYLETAHENLLIMCQIESAEAVENIPAIAAVEGVDVLFIGPNDLSGSIGKPATFDDPDVKALFERAEQRIVDSGTPLGGVIYGGASADELFARGYRFVTPASDSALLISAARAAAGTT